LPLRILAEYPRLIEPPACLVTPPRRAAWDRRRNRAQKEGLALSRHLSLNPAKVHGSNRALTLSTSTLNSQLFCWSLACHAVLSSRSFSEGCSLVRRQITHYFR